MKYIPFVLLLVQIIARGQSPCVNGFAGIYPCANIDLVAHIPASMMNGYATNEVWGWTDPEDGNEYVLLGTAAGMRFYDIADPYNPLLIGTLPTATTVSSWRTFRTYHNYLLVCSEAGGHGMQVFDLTRLRDVVNPPVVFDEDAHYNGFGACHTLSVCEEAGYAYACGTSTYSGGPHIINMQDPLNPVIVGGYALNGYTHESVVMIYDGPDDDYAGRTIAFCFNGSVPHPVTIADVTDPTDATTIAATTYPDKRYCHQGWLTEDKGYLIIDDELDEYQDIVDSTHTIIFDVHDLDNPIYMGYYVGGISIDHNQVIVGNLDYQSNYTAGMRILDVSQVADTILETVAFFDHYPANDNQVFEGEWMSYPFFESGIIPVTDIHDGMFLLKPNFISAEFQGEHCANESYSIQVALRHGFPGPYDISFEGLPAGVTASYDLDGVNAPSEFSIVFEGTETLEGNIDFEITVNGLYHSYSALIATEFIQPSSWYPDADLDGVGTDGIIIVACVQPDGYSGLNTDCDDTDPTIYAGAPGTFDDIDNDCNGVIEEDESSFCADLNGDGIITVVDLQIMMGNMDCSGENCLADFNGDFITDVTDLLILIADFGEWCP